MKVNLNIVVPIYVSTTVEIEYDPADYDTEGDELLQNLAKDYAMHEDVMEWKYEMADYDSNWNVEEVK